MDDDDDDLTTQRRHWQEQSGTFPVGSDGARRRARKQTHKSKRVAKRIGRSAGGNGIHKRRRRKFDG